MEYEINDSQTVHFGFPLHYIYHMMINSAAFIRIKKKSWPVAMHVEDEDTLLLEPFQCLITFIINLCKKLLN